MVSPTRITLYIDTYPGMDTKSVYANPAPGKKIPGTKRYAIHIDIPNLDEIDAELLAEAEEMEE